MPSSAVFDDDDEGGVWKCGSPHVINTGKTLPRFLILSTPLPVFFFFRPTFKICTKRVGHAEGSLSNYVHRIMGSMMGMIGCGHRLSQKLSHLAKKPQVLIVMRWFE